MSSFRHIQPTTNPVDNDSQTPTAPPVTAGGGPSDPRGVQGKRPRGSHQVAQACPQCRQSKAKVRHCYSLNPFLSSIMNPGRIHTGVDSGARGLVRPLASPTAYHASLPCPTDIPPVAIIAMDGVPVVSHMPSAAISTHTSVPLWTSTRISAPSTTCPN